MDTTRRGIESRLGDSCSEKHGVDEVQIEGSSRIDLQECYEQS